MTSPISSRYGIWSSLARGMKCGARVRAEALERLRERLPDLVITDWMMPLMGGAELCRRMREHPELASVPILVRTSAPPPQKAGNGWNACLQKPAPMQLFLTTVGRLCRRRR